MTSTIKVNNIQNQCGQNIINENSNTITIGASGDTIALASGASQTGFGRTGTVDWDTTAKTAGFTAVSGNGYFVNTTSGPLTVTLPASPSAGDIVAVADYAGTAATNNITIGRNGSNINGAATDLTISYENSAITLVYVDGTQGWKATDTSSLSDIALQPEYIVATGGTETTCGDYKIHRFTGPGTFCVSSVGNPTGSTTVDYLVVAGGAGTSTTPNNGWAGGGGAGGYRESPGTASGYTASPLGAAPATAITMTVQGYPIAIGGGGPNDANGSDSTALGITATGGGKGGNYIGNGTSGGSGGGGGGDITTSGGAGNTPPVSPAQGQPGGAGFDPAPEGGGGGGGAISAGSNGGPGGAGAGGNGANTGILGSSPLAPSTGTTGPAPGRYFAGGGGGGNGRADAGGSPTVTGGFGGGGTGGSTTPAPSIINGTPGTINTGGGGGGSGGTTGGSGIVIIRYKFQ